MKPVLSLDRLKQVLDYDIESGLFSWKKPPIVHARLRDFTAGGITTGYVMIKIDGQKYKAHRLAWFYVNGEWPSCDIDHINGCPLDNRMENLRMALNSQNQANRKRNNGKRTPKGVKLLPSGRFQSRITIECNLITLGTFNTAEEAQSAYMEAAKTHYVSFARAS